jgi:organic radical activating enzyme
MKTMDELVKSEYTDISITGGEPTLVSNKLEKLVHKLYEYNPNRKIYLYTNGNMSWHLTGFQSKISGVTIGCHEGQNLGVAIYAYKMYKTLGFTDVRFYIEEKHFEKLSPADKRIINTFNFYTWKVNDCEKSKDEDWIII